MFYSDEKITRRACCPAFTKLLWSYFKTMLLLLQADVDRRICCQYCTTELSARTIPREDGVHFHRGKEADDALNALAIFGVLLMAY